MHTDNIIWPHSTLINTLTKSQTYHSGLCHTMTSSSISKILKIWTNQLKIREKRHFPKTHLSSTLPQRGRTIRVSKMMNLYFQQVFPILQLRSKTLQLLNNIRKICRPKIQISVNKKWMIRKGCQKL